MLFECWIGPVPNQYFAMTCTHQPTPHQSDPFAWPIVNSSQSCVSCTASVLNNIIAPAPLGQPLVLVLQC